MISKRVFLSAYITWETKGSALRWHIQQGFLLETEEQCWQWETINWMCSTVQYSEERNMVIIQRMGKKAPEIIMKQNQKYCITGGDNTKRCSRLLQQTKFCFLHLLGEVCEHWVMSGDGGVAVIMWVDKILMQQFADLEGADGNTMHWGKGVTPPRSNWGSPLISTAFGTGAKSA